jgi:hypothetical protein
MKLQWNVHREPQWCTADGWKGLSILVRLMEGKGRELLIEYPFKKDAKGKTHLPQRPRINLASLEADIKAAMCAGWDPMSRGKTFAFQAQQTSN